MIGTLTSAEVERVLQTVQIARLGIYAGGRVRVYPVCFGYDGADIYVQSREGLKVQIMRAHPNVCVEVEQVASPARWRTVLAYGTFEELYDSAERDRAMALIANQGAEGLPPSLAPYQDGPERLVVYRIRLHEKEGRYEMDQPFPERFLG